MGVLVGVGPESPAFQLTLAVVGAGGVDANVDSSVGVGVGASVTVGVGVTVGLSPLLTKGP
jgi:hypothetical protein